VTPETWGSLFPIPLGSIPLSKKKKADLSISLLEFLVELRGIEPLTPRLPDKPE
jgi:hypothetical protein